MALQKYELVTPDLIQFLIVNTFSKLFMRESCVHFKHSPVRTTDHVWVMVKCFKF